MTKVSVAVILSSVALLSGCAATLKKLSEPKLSYTEYAGEPVTVILDRRHGQRREREEVTTSERRHAERRRQIQVDDAIRTRGFAVVPEIIGGA